MQVRRMLLRLFQTCLPLVITVASTSVLAQPSAEMPEAGLLVGNFVFGQTDGILRYDGRGNVVDNMIPSGTAGVVVTCCMTFGPDENLYVSSPLTGEVARFNGVTGAFIDKFVTAGSGGLVIPLILVFHDGHLYVGDTGAGAIRRYNALTGAFEGNLIPDNSQGMGQFGDLQQFLFGADGNVYVAAELSKRLLRFDSQTGSFVDEFIPSSEGFSPSGLTFASDGSLYVGSPEGSEVRRYDVHNGSYTVIIPAGGRLVAPVGLAFGPDSNLYVASLGTAEILKYDSTGQFLGAFVPSGSGGLTGPRAIAWKAKTKICHGNAGHYVNKTLTIGYLSARDHLLHGDTLGACE